MAERHTKDEDGLPHAGPTAEGESEGTPLATGSATAKRGGPDDGAPTERRAPAAVDSLSASPADPAALLGKVEPLIQQTRWADIVEALGPASRAAELPPGLALVYAMALAETAGDASTTEASLLAIRSVSALLGVPEGSGTALMVAKRVLRRNPVTWRRRPAPRAPIRLALIVVALFLGIVAGWLVAPSSIRLSEVIETLWR